MFAVGNVGVFGCVWWNVSEVLLGGGERFVNNGWDVLEKWIAGRRGD